MLRNLARPDKQIILPPVVLYENIPYNSDGMYVFPENGEIMIGEKFYPLDRGLIIISPTAEDFHLAHEYRHHWQFMQGWEYDGPGGWQQKGTYKESIINFYMNSRSEMDAHLYSLPWAKKDAPLQWQEWLIKANEDLVNRGSGHKIP